jgi:hypothetical protein
MKRLLNTCAWRASFRVTLPQPTYVKSSRAYQSESLDAFHGLQQISIREQNPILSESFRGMRGSYVWLIILLRHMSLFTIHGCRPSGKHATYRSFRIAVPHSAGLSEKSTLRIYSAADGASPTKNSRSFIAGSFFSRATTTQCISAPRLL